MRNRKTTPTKRQFEFSTKSRNTVDIEAVLNDEYSSNAMKLICLFADFLNVDIEPIADVKKNKDDKEFTIFRLSNADAIAIWEAL